MCDKTWEKRTVSAKEKEWCETRWSLSCEAGQETLASHGARTSEDSQGAPQVRSHSASRGSSGVCESPSSGARKRL